jgi:hypothetical protein
VSEIATGFEGKKIGQQALATLLTLIGSLRRLNPTKPIETILVSFGEFEYPKRDYAYAFN